MMKTLKQTYGFTFIEIILVLLLISIIIAVALNRTKDMGVEAAGGRAVIKNHIRYSQIMAMKSNTVCGIQFSGSTYSIFRNNSTADKVTLPNYNTTDFQIPSSLGSITETIYFDLWGTPYTNLALITPRPTGAIGSLGITMSTDTGYLQ